MNIIVGLGNIGREYNNTYHNIGFKVLDALAAKYGVTFNKKGLKSEYCETYICGQKTFLVKPTTFMNLSGECVVMFKNKYKLQDSNIFVVCDDIDLQPGKVRIKCNSSAGTHNGLRNITQFIGNGFYRVKVGVGRDSKFADLADFVLSRISKENMPILEESVLTAIDILEDQIEQQL